MRISQVVPGEEHCITVRFDNHHSVILNMAGKMRTVRFSGLKNETVFRAVRTDGNSIHWPGGISVAISEILEIIAQ